MTAPDDTAASWRDLADQLTPAQVAKLERFERDADNPATASWLLQLAREDAADNLVDVQMAHVDLPAGAVTVWPWQRDDTGAQFREFEHQTRRAGAATVHVSGRQCADGATERWITVAAHLSAADARVLADALLAAAAEIEATKRP